MQTQFGLIPNDSTVYCFIQDNQCQNCFRYDGLDLPVDVNQHMVIISGFPPSNFIHFRHVYYDSTQSLLQLQTLDYGNKLGIFKHDAFVLIPMHDLYAQADSLVQHMHP